MITDQLQALTDYLRDKLAVNVSLGDRDLGVDDYPHVLIVPSGSFSVYTDQVTKNRITMRLTISAIVSRKNELEGLALFEKILAHLPGFAYQKGHEFIGEGAIEYDENTFKINLNYQLKIMAL